MNQRIRTFAIAGLLLATAVAGGAVRSAHAAPAGADRWQRIDRYVEVQMGANHVPGAALAVVENGTTVYSHGYGRSASGSITAQTPFMIGSNTKSFTALAVMQLVEEGRIEIDAPVQRYVPQFQLADTQASQAITVRELLNHTSGMPANAGGGVVEGATAVTPEEGLAALRSVRLTAAPGTTYQYSNAGYMVLGLVVQDASGEPYTAYVQHHILDPLDMRHTYLTLDAAKQGGMAAGYRYWFGVPVADDWHYGSAMVSAGGVISTAEDMAHYLTMYLNHGSYQGKALLSPGGIAAMETPAVDANSTQIGETVKLQYGMGWAIGDLRGVPAVYHTGGTPNFASWMILVPRDNRALVVLTDADNFIPGSNAPDAFDIPIGVNNLLAGQAPNPHGPTMTRLYLYLDLGVLLVLGLQIWSLVRLLRRRLSVALRPEGVGTVLAQARQTILPLAWELGLSIYALAALPRLLTGADWAYIFVWVPDLGVVILLICGLWLLTGATRIARTARALRASGLGPQPTVSGSAGTRAPGSVMPLHRWARRASRPRSAGARCIAPASPLRRGRRSGVHFRLAGVGDDVVIGAAGLPAGHPCIKRRLQIFHQHRLAVGRRLQHLDHRAVLEEHSVSRFESIDLHVAPPWLPGSNRAL